MASPAAPILCLTVADLINALNTLVPIVGNQASTPISSSDGQTGFKVRQENISIKIVPASEPGEGIGE